MIEQVESEANEPVLVGDENSLNLTTLDALNQHEETLALEVHAAADFLNPLVNSNCASPAIFLHRRHLRLQVVAMPSATDAAVHDCRSLLRPAAKYRPNIGLVKVPMSGRQALSRQDALALPAAHRAWSPSDALCEFVDPINLAHGEQL
ncbi:hypothetical protein RM96_15540 [Cupriavidus sp. IDO]|nr:hypothetical protein RM96_15540 [Cupriavidus sp. IDO]